MKKKLLMVSLLGLVVLGACSKEDTNQETLETSNEITESSGTDIMGEESIYTAILLDDAYENDGTISIPITDVTAESDLNELTTVGDEGVVLNADSKTVTLLNPDESLKKGDKVRFTLQSPVIMTMSIPPQIPGSVIVQVTQIQ